MSRYPLTPRRRNLLGGLLSGLESRSDDGAGAADSRSFGSPGDKRRGPSSPSGLFSLLQPVGPNKPNRRRDVGRVESLLTASGHLKQGADHAPGRFSPALEKAVKGYQRDWKLKVDGLLNPAGPTLRAFKVQASRPLRPVPMDEVAGNRRTVDALLKSASLGMVPTLIADVHQSGGEKGRASLNDFFGQLKSLSPGKTTDLLEAANKKIARDGGRPLSFLDLPALAKPMGNDDDDDEEPPEDPPSDPPGDPDPDDPKDPDPDPPKDPPKDPKPDPDPDDPPDDDDDEEDCPKAPSESEILAATEAVHDAEVKVEKAEENVAKSNEIFKAAQQKVTKHEQEVTKTQKEVDELKAEIERVKEVLEITLKNDDLSQDDRSEENLPDVLKGIGFYKRLRQSTKTVTGTVGKNLMKIQFLAKLEVLEKLLQEAEVKLSEATQKLQQAEEKRDKAEKALEVANSKLEEAQAILEEAQDHLEDLLAQKEEAEECQKRKG